MTTSRHYHAGGHNVEPREAHRGTWVAREMPDKTMTVGNGFGKSTEFHNCEGSTACPDWDGIETRALVHGPTSIILYLSTL